MMSSAASRPPSADSRCVAGARAARMRRPAVRLPASRRRASRRVRGRSAARTTSRIRSKELSRWTRSRARADGRPTRSGRARPTDPYEREHVTPFRLPASRALLARQPAVPVRQLLARARNGRHRARLPGAPGCGTAPRAAHDWRDLLTLAELEPGSFRDARAPRRPRHRHRRARWAATRGAFRTAAPSSSTTGKTSSDRWRS